MPLSAETSIPISDFITSAMPVGVASKTANPVTTILALSTMEPGVLPLVPRE